MERHEAVSEWQSVLLARRLLYRDGSWAFGSAGRSGDRPTEAAMVMESGMRQEDAFRLRECRLYNPHHPPILPHLPLF